VVIEAFAGILVAPLDLGKNFSCFFPSAMPVKRSVMVVNPCEGSRVLTLPGRKREAPPLVSSAKKEVE
jgi:hypothetical protein